MYLVKLIFFSNLYVWKKQSMAVILFAVSGTSWFSIDTCKEWYQTDQSIVIDLTKYELTNVDWQESTTVDQNCTATNIKPKIIDLDNDKSFYFEYNFVY